MRSVVDLTSAVETGSGVDPDLVASRADLNVSAIILLALANVVMASPMTSTSFVFFDGVGFDEVEPLRSSESG